MKTLVAAAALRGDGKEREGSRLGQMQTSAGRCPCSCEAPCVPHSGCQAASAASADGKPPQGTTQWIGKIKPGTLWVFSLEMAQLHV